MLVSKFFNSISAFPLHVYYTALPNSSTTTTLLYQTYAATLFDLEETILKKLQEVGTAVDEVKW